MNDEQIKFDLLKCLNHNDKIDLLSESSMSRIYQLIENPKYQFAVVSAFRKDLDGNVAEQNEKRHAELKNWCRKHGYGFIEMRGAWKEEGDSGTDIFEKSLLIGKITRDEAIELCHTYDQDAVIWHGNGRFELIDRNGNVNHFSKTSFEVKDQTVEELQELMEKDPAKFERMFIVGSWLKRGGKSKTGRKFNFVLESKMNPSWMRGMKEMKLGSDSTWFRDLEFSMEV